MVARAGQAQERGVRPGLARHDRHAEGLLVEGDAPLQVGHEQHGVVEADGVDGHGGLDSRGVWSGLGGAGGQAATPKPPVQETFSLAARVSCRKPRASSSRARLSGAGVDRVETAGGEDAGQGGLGVGVVAGDQHGGGQRADGAGGEGAGEGGVERLEHARLREGGGDLGGGGAVGGTTRESKVSKFSGLVMSTTILPARLSPRWAMTSADGGVGDGEDDDVAGDRRWRCRSRRAAGRCGRPWPRRRRWPGPCCRCR